MEKILVIVNTILENKGKQKLNTLSESDDLRKDLGFDSLDLAELTVRIETEYDVDIFADGLVYTIGDIVKKLS